MRPLRREMQMVFQDPYSSLNPRQTVGQIIGTPFAIHKTEGSTKRKVQELMNRVGLNPEHYNRYPHEFSGGQRQRIGVARALALSPKLIVCDEPVSALDVSIQAQILNLLLSLQRDFDLTYLFISHDLGVVRHVSDRIAVMYLGRIVELGSADEVYRTPKHPYTAALLSAVPKGGGDGDGRQRVVLTGDVPSPVDPPTGCPFHPRCPKARLVSGNPEQVPESCRNDSPELRPVERDHLAACWYPLQEGERLRSAAEHGRCRSSRPLSRTTSERSTTPPGWQRLHQRLRPSAIVGTGRHGHRRDHRSAPRLQPRSRVGIASPRRRALRARAAAPAAAPFDVARVAGSSQTRSRGRRRWCGRRRTRGPLEPSSIRGHLPGAGSATGSQRPPWPPRSELPQVCSRRPAVSARRRSRGR